MSAAQRAAADMLPEAVRWLEAWLRIPSISGSARHHADLAEAARFLAARLRRFAQVQVVRSAAGPVVMARVAGRDARRPALLVYGHLDVKPAGPGWHSDAFTPVRRGRRLVARGASDDKGQLLAHLVALESWVAVGGPPGDVIVLVESAEEIGSPGLATVLERVRGPVGAVLVSDTREAARGVPSLTVTQRGLIGLRVSVDAGGAAVHAGRYGGAVRDPSLVLGSALQRAGRLLASIPADPAVPAMSPAADEAIRRTAARAVHRDRLTERVTARAALSVTSLAAGGPPGAVPRTASARLDVRLPPSLDPRQVLPALRAALTGSDRGALVVDVQVDGACRGFVARHSAETVEAVSRACRHAFGRPCRVVGSGGSIPAVVALQEAFGCSPVLLGLGPVDDGAHGPDEHLDLDGFARGVHTSVDLHHALVPKSHPPESLPRRSNSARHVFIGHSGPSARMDAGKTSGIPQRLERRDG